MTKLCGGCNKTLAVINFSRRKDNYYRPISRCKSCVSGYSKKWYQANQEARLEQTRAYQELHRTYYRKAVRAHYNKQPFYYTEKTRRRRFAEKKQTPAWANLTLIRDFYRNCPSGMEVDHIYPINGKAISGLHVLANLQYLTPEQNRFKSNKMPDARGVICQIL